MLLDVLPRNRLAYRDRGVLSVNPATVTKLTLIREGTVTTVLEPDRSASAANQWRMVTPVVAPADVRAITQLLALLSDLRAEDFAADAVGDGKIFGLDQPPLVVSWDSEPATGGTGQTRRFPATIVHIHEARADACGSASPSPASRAHSMRRSTAQPFVFTLGAPAVQALLAEFHDTLVLSFPADSIRRLVLRVPGRTLAFIRNPRPGGAGRPTGSQSQEPKRPAIDLSRFNDLVKPAWSAACTSGFFSTTVRFPPRRAWPRPRLTVELGSDPGKPPHVLRIGETYGGLVDATVGTSDTGPVLLLPAAAWNALIPAGGCPRLPANPFATSLVTLAGSLRPRV